jgi:glutamyl-tRNA(Gln) amidotransferase subunit E
MDPPLDFPDADFGALSRGDYEALGFMAGLEVHQQLLTKSKLFCRCPAGRYPTHYDAMVLRHMRPTLSELGEYDGTALMEFKTRKEIVYRLERNSVCTYEIDDTPPFGMDEEAIRIALEIAQLERLNLVSELHVMRKQYLDGSIPTGFQRTAMVGLDGVIPLDLPEMGIRRDLPIRQLSIEEDSCREVSDVGHRVTFSTGRLGVPLIETVTEPELFTPLELEAAGRIIADVARASGKVRRGPGAARQDVNVSVAGGRRVEIKGVHMHRVLPRLVHVEAFRQLNLLRIRAELQRRGVDAPDLDLPEKGLPWEVSPLVVEVGGLAGLSGYRPVRDAAEAGMTVCAVRLPGFGALLAHRTQPGFAFAQEFSERIRVIACPVHRPFMAHSDAPDGVGELMWSELRRLLGADSGDAVVLVWADESDAATAAREVLLRAQDALVGIPSETRQANPNGTTGFERVLPGPDRMYPDTDTPPIPVRDETVAEIRARLPETPWDREDRYRTTGLEPSVARVLSRSPWAKLFDAAGVLDEALARRWAFALLKRMPHHTRRARSEPWVDPARVGAVVRAVADGEVRPEAVERLLDAVVTEPEVAPTDIVRRYRRDAGNGELFEATIASVAGRAADLQGRSADTLLRWAMGEAMKPLLGREDPARVRICLAEALGVAAGVAS